MPAVVPLKEIGRTPCGGMTPISATAIPAASKVGLRTDGGLQTTGTLLLDFSERSAKI